MARQRRQLEDQLADLMTMARGTRTNALTTPGMAAVGPDMIEDGAILNQHLSEHAVAMENLDATLQGTIESLSGNEAVLADTAARLDAAQGRIDSLFDEVSEVPEQIAAATLAATTAAAVDAKERADAAQAAAVAAAQAYTDANAGGAGTPEQLEELRRDAQGKADAAKAAAIAAAAADATAKADKALADAKADATAKADQAEADAITAAAGDATTKMNNVANSKNATFYGTATPTATAPKGGLAGDTYRRRNSAGNIIGEWEWSGTAWTQRKMTSESMTAVDVGVLTAGSAVIQDAVAQKIAAGTAAIQKADIGNLTVTGTTNLADAVARRIAANTGQFIEVYTDQLKAKDAQLDKAVVDKLYGEVVESRKIKTELLEANSVTADILESNLVLSSKIVAGDPAGTRAEMSPAGFKVYAKQQGSADPATEVVRMGVAETDDYFAVTKADGQLAATISQDGKISGSEVYANEELYFQGQKFSEILESLPRGALYKAELSGGRISNIDTTYGLVEASWVHETDRLIRLDFGMKTFPNSTSETEVHLDVYYTKDGSKPTINSNRLFADAIALGRISQGSFDFKTFSHTIRPATFGNVAPGDTLRMLMCVRKGLGNPFHVEPGLQTFMYVTDIGPGLPHTPNHNNGGGKLSSGTSTVTIPKVTRTAEWTANAIRNYQGNGSVYPINNGKIYQGLSPAGYGNLCSAAIFPDMTATLSGASINWIKVYLYFEHWYNNAGGTARIGLTGKSLPGSMTAGGLATSSGGWPKPGGRWVNIPSNLWDGFKTGQWGGITLNGDGGYGTYGYASGNPKIQINYTK